VRKEQQELMFDKFMDDIVKREDQSKQKDPGDPEEVTLSREYYIKYRETSKNLIKVGKNEDSKTNKR